MERVADYIIKSIQEAGVAHIFLVTGRGILQLTDAVAKNPDIKGISTLHEQSASFAAMTYAKTTGKIGACLVSTGCAATNAITGCLCAYQDNLPVVFLSGQHRLQETTRYTKAPIRTYGSQEADIISLVKPITKYAVMLTDPLQTVYELQKALYLACEGRKGPVWIDIPLDIQGMRIESKELGNFEIPKTEINKNSLIEKVKKVAIELEKAKRPLLLVGGGCAFCKGEIERFVETFQIPIVYTFAACDIYGSGNQLSIGAIGSIGAPRAGNFTLQNADYVIAIGSKLCSQTIGSAPEKIARNAKIIVVDIDSREHLKVGIRIDQFIQSDAKEFLDELQNKLKHLDIENWIRTCIHWKNLFLAEKEEFVLESDGTDRIDLYQFAVSLKEYMNEETVLITDAGLEELIIPSTIPYEKSQRCFFPATQGAMGYAIPAILGAWYGGYKDIIVVVGDGSIMMNLQELQVLAYHQVPVKICVINNNMYSVIRSRQKDLFRTRTIGNDPGDGVPTCDFNKIAEAFSMEYFCITGKKDLIEGLNKLANTNTMTLCEIMCKTEQKYFHTSFRRGKNGGIMRPSIEDQSPFMDRELFLSEMIVEPIDL